MKVQDQFSLHQIFFFRLEMMSNTTSTTTTAGARSKFPFTATQWQELEHQALIYKYMTAGIPVPPDLLFSIKRSVDSSLSSKLFPYPPSPLGWNPYQMGYGKKIDPEPGRCRRTDGKKWRCSKEAYPDSKYCERHMHRGKNRSRKPVENSAVTSSSVATTTITMPTNSTAPNNSSILTNQSLLSTTTTPYNHTTKNPPSLYSLSSDHSPYSSLYPHPTPSYNQKDFSRERYFQGMKEEVGEHAFFTESSGSTMRGFSTSSMDESWPLSNLDHSKQSNGYPNSYLHNNATSKQQQAEKQCYIWGRDFNCELSMKVDQDERENNEKTTPHHFFDEWAPLKDGNGSGHGGGGERKYSSWHDSSPSTTQLSISIPSSTSHHDFFLSNSRPHHHEG